MITFWWQRVYLVVQVPLLVAWLGMWGWAGYDSWVYNQWEGPDPEEYPSAAADPWVLRTEGLSDVEIVDEIRGRWISVENDPRMWEFGGERKLQVLNGFLVDHYYQLWAQDRWETLRPRLESLARFLAYEIKTENRAALLVSLNGESGAIFWGGLGLNSGVAVLYWGLVFIVRGPRRDQTKRA